MKQLRIDSNENLYFDYKKLIFQYDNPIFVCDRQTARKIQKSQYPNGEYMWGLDFKKKKLLFWRSTIIMTEILFGKILIEDENVNGLFIMENNYKD